MHGKLIVYYTVVAWVTIIKQCDSVYFYKLPNANLLAKYHLSWTVSLKHIAVMDLEEARRAPQFLAPAVLWRSKDFFNPVRLRFNNRP